MNLSLLQNLQDDFTHLLLSDKLLSKAAVLQEDKGLLESEAREALGVLNPRSNRVGIAILVLMPSLNLVENESEITKVRIFQTARVLENPTLNRSEEGTGQTASFVSLRVMQLARGWRPYPHEDPRRCFFLSDEPLVPIHVEGHVGYDVRFVFQDFLPTHPRAISPTFRQENTKLFIESPQAVARLYRTTDGSLPHPDNPQAVSTRGPFPLPSPPAHIRAVAFVAGSLPSHAAAWTLS